MGSRHVVNTDNPLLKRGGAALMGKRCLYPEAASRPPSPPGRPRANSERWRRGEPRNVDHASAITRSAIS